MDPVAFAALAFVLMLCSVAFGMFMRRILPGHHINGDSKDVIKLSTALIATMSALVLALLFASTRTAFEHTSSYVSRMTADVTELDRLLERYGLETAQLRTTLRAGIGPMIDSIWRDTASARGRSPDAARNYDETMLAMLQELTPKNSAQTAIRTRAIGVITDLSQTQLALLAQPTDSVSQTFMIVLVLWLMFIFTTFSMTAPPNPTLIIILGLSVASATAAIYLIEELHLPFDGLMQISSNGLRNALK